MTIREAAPRRHPAARRSKPGGSSREALLAGVSALVLVLATAEDVDARALNGAAAPGNSAAANASVAAQAAAVQAAAAAQRSRDSLNRAVSALQSMRQLQGAAAAAARAGASSVPNGVGPGGLQPVTNPLLSAQDQPTGLRTWDGALLPMQSVASDGKVDVNIRQTQSNAILSWDSFNVGRDTRLTFDQQGNANWVALNRVVGNDLAPSRILGSIKSDGSVLVINRNGIIFGGSSQINVGSLMASSIDVGPSTLASPTDLSGIGKRNEIFLQYGLLGYADSGGRDTATFSAVRDAIGQGPVEVQKGASLTTSRDDGLLMLLAPRVINEGYMSAPKGQVVLAAGTKFLLTRATGAADSSNPNIRGLFVRAIDQLDGANQQFPGFYAWNKTAGLIEAAQGNITLTSAESGTKILQGGIFALKPGGAVINDGVLWSTTSVSRNGSIIVGGGDIRLSSGSLIAIGAESSAETIPQDATSLTNFKPSDIRIGNGISNIEMQSGALIYAPSANVTFGVPSGASVTAPNRYDSITTATIFVDSGATIDVAGLTDVVIPASRNQVVISPVKGNELRDSPLYRAGFLDGATVYLDPRLSGVRADGVAWIGSPLIDAASYYALVGVGAAELMTKGGNVTLGANAYYRTNSDPMIAVPGSTASSVIVKSGAVINMAGGWVSYEAGKVRTTTLVSSTGRRVPIGKADPNDTYVGIYEGFTVNHARWGFKEVYADPFHSGERFETAYTEGRDAGTLTLKVAAAAFDGTIYGDAFAGRRQIAESKTGSGKNIVYGDKRAVQGATSQLPTGGMLFVQADSGGGDIRISHDPAPLSADFDYGQRFVLGPDGPYVYAPRRPDSILPAGRLNTITISDRLIRSAGLSEVALYSGGSVIVDADANVALKPGGVFDAFGGRKISIAGGISAPGGKVLLETYYGDGSVFAPTKAALGSFDIVIDGNISVAGRWVNDFGTATLDPLGSAWLSGGSIAMYVASRDLQLNGSGPTGSGGVMSDWGQVGYDGPGTSLTTTDISGSILINAGAKLNLAGGGRIDQKGKLNATAKGGNLSLRSDTGYFQIGSDLQYDGNRLRVASNTPSGPVIVNNPSQINARIVFDPAAIEAHGFGGGGTFTLVTPEIRLGEGTSTTGTVLPLDFFSTAGFSTYNITSYKTDFSPNTFANGKGGYNALLATQTLTIAAGQTLLLAQSMLPSMLNTAQSEMLRNLTTGSDLRAVLSPIVPDNAWDSKAVNLNLGGLIELHVAQGGQVIGTAGSTLTVSKLFNEGTIRLPGGTITQQLILPSIYAGGFGDTRPNQGGVRALSDIFSVRADGLIYLTDLNAKGLKAGDGRILTNQEVASDAGGGFREMIYLLGLLDADQGVVLAPGSVTDLSGIAIFNPRATRPDGTALRAGRVVAGGTLASPAASQDGALLFVAQKNSSFVQNNATGWRVSETIVARPGSVLDLSGASAAFDQLAGNAGLNARGRYVSMPAWSDAGLLMAANGATLAGATIRATGGSSQANGGTLVMLDPVLTQHDPSVPARNVVSADMISRAGFDTLAAIGSISSLGDATIELGRGFFLQSRPYQGVVGPNSITGVDPLLAVVRSGGRLEIDAPFIGITSTFDTIFNPNIGTVGTGSVVFKADQIDISGAVIFDRSVASATLQSSGDIRLTGVQPWRRTYDPTFTASVYTLEGALAANGDVSLVAGQIYPTTGSNFTISSTAADGTVTFGRSGSAAPATPYSAGGNLSVYATNIRQGGVIRVPFGTLTLGSNSIHTKGTATNFAPATLNVTLLDGSITSVSANGLVIPYGITTDQKEWYFAPTGLDALSGPPVKIMQIAGNNIAINAGATVDLSGGGDVYGYEFIPGTGGSRDVLDRFNSDQYSGNRGYQYADGRQVYAIVPGLSSSAAIYDPIYSADYANLYSPSAVGRRVYLDAALGLAAGWYTLLPAKYAMLPGGMRVVEQTAGGMVRGIGGQYADGSLIVSGFYGDTFSGSAQSDVKGFNLQSQAVILRNSRIALTSGDAIAKSLAAANGKLTPRLGVDAGRLILNPIAALSIDIAVSSAAAPGGRGSQIDIGGKNFDIVSRLADAPADGAIHVTADSLTRLNAESLLIGGIRTDNADGTTSLNITAQTILLANDAAHPLSAPEIVLAVDDQVKNPAASHITLADGATVIATGVLTDERSGNYVIDGRVTTTTKNSNIYHTSPLVTAEGALFRVANGPERLVTRLRDAQSPVVPGASLIVGNIIARASVIGFDTSGSVDVNGNALLQARSISLGAPKIAFTSGAGGAGTVVVTPQLQALLSQGDRLTLHAQTTIGFDNGAYRFASINFDAQNLVGLQGGNVAITADRLGLSNSTGAAGTATGGVGALDISANEIVFGSGAMATTGFGAGVQLSAAAGIFTAGYGGVFDVGAANLTVATPYLGDRAMTAKANEAGFDMVLRSTGSVLITDAGLASVDASKVPGVPGSALTIEGHGITVCRTHLRATAGSLNLRSSADIVLADTAMLEAPGYEKVFGDSADPVVRSSPGGSLTLSAEGAGGINLGNATLSVGGGKGNGGKLALSTPNGVVDFASATLNGSGGAGFSGGSFALDILGAIDLVALNNRVGPLGFTGGFELRTRSGDIVLAAGQTLRSGKVNLTADGGFVTIGGAIDTSGINGGDIALYGVHGVSLLAGARLDTGASGYAVDDTRQAKAGNVILGTDFIPGTAVTQADGSIAGSSGSIFVASGATIDVSARRPGDRLVRLLRNGVVYYQVASGDEGGVVTLRAPVIDGGGGKTMNVKVEAATSVVGARTVELEGFKRWDLRAVANSGLYSGVKYYAIDTRLPDGTLSYKANTIALDVADGLDTARQDGTPNSVAGLNFLGDNGAGTVVDFVRNFTLTTTTYDNLGGLASRSNFQARPGIDLIHGGHIDLASNWNLGAGAVNVTAALAAQDPVMKTDPITGPYVVVGKEAELLANYTTMTYRVGGKPTGAAPVLSLRAGGDLHLKGSITDGFFQFRDQYDPTYQGTIAGGGGSVLQLGGGDYNGFFVDWSTYTTSPSPWNNYYQQFMDSFSYRSKGIDELGGASGGTPPVAPPIPFNALGNSAAALSSGPGGVGDALASAVVFPMLPGGPVASSSYRLVAGATPASVDPLRVAGHGPGTLIVDGAKPITLMLSGGGLTLDIWDAQYGEYDNSFKSGQSGFDNYLINLFDLNGLSGLSGDSAIVLPYRTTIPASFKAFIDRTLANDPGAHVKIWHAPDFYIDDMQEVAISLSLFSQFLAETPSGFGGGPSIPLLRQTVIRTGTGNISMAAASDVDLRGPATPIYLNQAGKDVGAPPLSANGATNPSQQLGGAAVYTVGHIASVAPKVLVDPVDSRITVTINPASAISTAGIFSAPPEFTYGTSDPNTASGRGAPGVVLADPVYLEGGGNVSVFAGRDVLGRRDMSLSDRIRRYGGSSFTGTRDQPWRLGTIGMATNVSVNPQLFNEGLGTLGGGNILVSAGRDVSDISMIADTSLITVNPDAGSNTPVLMAFGGGNVSVGAVRDILGGRLDVGSGTAVLSAGRDIRDAGSIIINTVYEVHYDPDTTFGGTLHYVRNSLANQLRIRVSDATADISAGGAISLQGIAALGVGPSGGAASGGNGPTAVDNMSGFYSSYSGLNLLANGRITVTNNGASTSNGYYDLLAATSNSGSDTAIYPASLAVASLAGDVNLAAGGPSIIDGGTNLAKNILLVPSSHGQLRLFAGRDIVATTIAMLDSDPGQLPGVFSTYFNTGSGVTGGLRFDFPAVFSTTSDYELGQLHNKVATHGDDREPVYLYAGNDIGSSKLGVTLSVPKQARINAGNDIVNMMFFGQNLADRDASRIVAGRDITATTQLVEPLLSYDLGNFGTVTKSYGAARPALQGNTFILGGPGDLFVEAGRNLGPFLNSSVSLEVVLLDGTGSLVDKRLQTFGGGILSVGNQRNPYLPSTGANLNVLFGVANGADYDGLRDTYLVPGSAANTLGGYSTRLIDWMRNNANAELRATYNTVDVTAEDAYAVFVTLPELRQRSYLIKQVYFNELAATADPKSVSYLKYSRGYAAVNTLFPASLGYTANGLEGGAIDTARVPTGDLDLRLAAIETMYGGDVSILGPGGRVIAGSVVSTSQQVARRTYDGARLFAGGKAYSAGLATTSLSIPSGYEGVLTLRGGNIYSFTDGDFLLNQSRLFTEQGGDIKMWSSNGDLNAGQGPKTSANFPPIVAHIDQNAVITVDVLGGVTGAGIAALKSMPDAPDADVYLIAPRGKVDAGDAGVRVSGNLSVAALVVVNADNFKVGGTTAGIPVVQAPNVTGLAAAANATTATQQTTVPGQGSGNSQPSVIIVEVLGYGGGDQQSPTRPDPDEERRRNQTQNTTQDPNSRFQIVGVGAATEEEARRMAEEKRIQLGR